MNPQHIRIASVDLDFEQDDQEVGDCLIGKRNVIAVQSALIRGEEEVFLFNWKSFPQHLWQYVSPWDQRPIGQETVHHFTDFPKRDAPYDPLGPLSQDARKMIENKRWNGMNFKLIKVLAQGGHGYVTLWDVVFEDKSVRRVVIKRPIDSSTNSFDPYKEAEFHLRYGGAQHTTQVIDLHREVVDIRNRMMKSGTIDACALRVGKDWKAEEQKCVVFEYMKFGDMVNIMQTVATRNVQIPAQVLWGIWECLVLALATIAYTPSDSSGNSSFETWWKDVVSDRDEAMAFLDHVERDWKIEHDVHLDLEVLNVLAGHDPATHPDQPVFKLHDLGAWSYKMNQFWESHNEDEIWSMRDPVKPHAATPEQFSRDWDSIRVSLPEPTLRQFFGGEDLEKLGGMEVAGRFGMWTNIFLIAKVMESIITREFSRFPYKAVDHDETNKPTHGGRLQTPQFQHIDMELRQIVTRCLHEKPKDRPLITQILRNILGRKEQGFNNKGPQSVHQWWKALFEPQAPKPIAAQAPPPANPVKQAVVASAAKGGLAIASHMVQAVGNQGAPNQPQAPRNTPPHLRRAQPNMKETPAQPPVQPQVPPQVQPQAPRVTPPHLRKPPFDQRRFSFKPSPKVNVKASVKASVKANVEVNVRASVRASIMVNAKASIEFSPEPNSPQPGLRFSLNSNIKLTGLDPSLKFNPKLSSLKYSLELILMFSLTYEGANIT
ncbi:hypothetical protein FGLOB1_1620 [Fusarium globosum]|uniref:Protein kinase domain-containing protein n=1 Tax=Fusarium globosum TaxID=78864 RepID=A0A8H5YT41_9HYPO|nr:hypothetical protein FGLOB1_1620 [Fusarium globosum]